MLRRFRPQVVGLEAREVPAALLQVVHNSPYAVASQVDVYVNGDKLLDNFAFRTATPYVEVPSGVDLTIQVAPGTSKSAADAIFSATVKLADKTNYVAVAAGDPLAAGDTKFNLEVFAPARTKAADASKVDVLVFHGSPDAPAVDVKAGTATLIDGFEFRDFAGYLSVPAAKYTLDVTLDDGVTNVRSFTADLSGAAGKSVTVLASGFVVPPAGSKNDFQLLAAFADGTTALLPVVAPTVNGTAGRDLIFLSESGGVLTAEVNGVVTKFLSATNPRVTVNGLGGDDYINAVFTRSDGLTLNGNAGRDTIVGGSGDNRINGGAGNDLLFGLGGDDTITGGDGNDILFGGPGRDHLDGGPGFDLVFDFSWGWGGGDDDDDDGDDD
jgi:Ca2+-binding RTX toxin-like protein